jgi:hypothetical protein
MKLASAGHDCPDCKEKSWFKTVFVAFVKSAGKSYSKMHCPVCDSYFYMLAE